MSVRSIGFVGIRSERLDETVILFRDVIGIPVVRQTDHLAGFTLADGTVFEIYGPGEPFHAFFMTGPVLGSRWTISMPPAGRWSPPAWNSSAKRNTRIA